MTFLYIGINEDSDDTLWYYRRLADAYREPGAPGCLVRDLARVVSEIEELAAAS